MWVMRTKTSSEYDGINRVLYELTCVTCGDKYWRPKHRMAASRCCSRACFGVAQRHRERLECAWCHSPFLRKVSSSCNSKSGFRFCSRVCKDKAQRLEGIREIQPGHYGTAAVCKELLFRSRGLKCQNCKRTQWLGQPISIEVHHVDGDNTNNIDSNLLLLCPNCHAQTFSYCRARKGRCQ